MALELDPLLASRLAKAALGHVGREYPNVLVHVLGGPADARTPRDLHPVFHGSYDWHSCVHGHWLLARLLRLFPRFPEADAIRDHFNQVLTTEAAAGEVAYFARPTSAGFERPYGWAWLLLLAVELHAHENRGWGEILRPLSEAVRLRFLNFLPKADYPVRAGVHSNTAFALSLAAEYAAVFADGALAALVREKALAWYVDDTDCQAWEPSGDDFLSPALIETQLMLRVLEPTAFRAWFAHFLPRAAAGEPATLFRPVRVSDRSDGKIAHLDGLNLSRAWCWRDVAGALAPDDPIRPLAMQSAEQHLAASLPHVTGDYMGEHWLASFALLALLG